MKLTRVAFAFVLSLAVLPARATPEPEDWTAFGHLLTLMHAVVRAGAQSYPEQAVAELLSGRNPEANGALAGLFAGATAEMPEPYRERLAAIGRDLAGYAAKHPVVGAADRLATERSLQARKELTAMGLRYHDERDFLDAVRRNDRLAVELYIAGRGVNLGARTWTGRSALDIARDDGNRELAELLARNLPSAR